MIVRDRHWLAGLSLGALALGGCAGTPSPVKAESFSVGRNGTGEPCTATRSYADPGLKGPFDQAFTIGCRNVAASRSLGAVRVFADAASRAAAEKALECGPTAPVTLKGIGPVDVRRCYDQVLASTSVSWSQRRGNRVFVVSAAEAVLGPAEEAFRILVGGAPLSDDPGRDTVSEIAVAALPAAPAGTAAAATGSDFDPTTALAEGISDNHKGLFVQASRVLNDALSRVGRDAQPQTRAELLLEAGLADSNIRFNESAQEHFTEADALLAGQAGPRLAFLARKRDAYRALDLLNQRKFREALGALDKLVSRLAPVGQPLEDAAVIRLLNQPPRGSANVSSSIAVPETAELQQLTLDAQASWARSISLLALGDVRGAQTALDRALVSYRPLVNERIDQRLVLWLGAQLNRQQGRLQTRAKDYPAAIASFDRALAELRRSALGTAGTGTEPSIAEASLERAGIIAQQGGDPVRVRHEYDLAIDAMIDANQGGGSAVLPTGVERYLDLLVAEADKSPSPDTFDRFFRAVQAVGEPAVARQLNQLQTVVTSDPAIGVKVRDRAELERDITRLRYDIAAAAQAGQPTADLDKQRSTAEAKLLQVDAELGANSKYKTIDDRPTTIATLRQALRPGEGYLKIVELNRRAYGIYINADRTWIYPLELPKAALDGLAAGVRASIDGKLPDKLVPFDVAGAYGLFRLVSGPATDAVLKANALVVDPAGPLQNLPAGVLVTDRKSVDDYKASATAAPFDFSHVSFLAAHATISTAVSPRSFLVARSLPPSTAKQAFLGLGEHVAPASDGAPRDVSVGFGCTVSFATLAGFERQLTPIDRKELVIASAALGVPNAPEVVGQDFTDTAVQARGDLADFEVIHFATHGLEEGVWGCNKSPPALVTSFGDKDSDGLLSFSEIARLRLDANLVVLSACDTASGVKDESLARRSGQEEAGSTLEGLVRAFLTANSRAVLATFWPVSAGGETDQFIKQFYGVARQRTIGGSLQVAQETLMTTPEFSHPFYWGPYFLVGDSTKMMLSTPAKQVAAR